MVWPFSKRSSHEAVYERLYGFLNDEAAQVARYPDSLRKSIDARREADETVEGFGAFGGVTNAIPVNGPIGEVLYLSSLRFQGERVLFHRLRSTGSVDAYECVSMNGKRWEVLYFDMYYPRKSRRAPPGYAIDSKNVLISGVNFLAPDFPRALYAQIGPLTEKLFGMSLAAPDVRLALESRNYRRPAPFVRKLMAAKGTPLPKKTEAAMIQELFDEAIAAQTSLFDQLRTFLDHRGSLKPDEIQIFEIVYLVLALTAYSIFKWGGFKDAAGAADQISLRVLRFNNQANDLQLKLTDLVRAYQHRHSQYFEALLRVEHDPIALGFIASHSICGKSDALIATELSASIATVMDVQKEVLIEL